MDGLEGFKTPALDASCQKGTSFLREEQHDEYNTEHPSTAINTEHPFRR